jgi:predicted molibdopterin-dependent oxidoreductase YjgC
MLIEIVIDGVTRTAEEGTYLLDVLRRLDIRVPSLCFHPALKKPIGTCRLCFVEVGSENAPRRIQRSCTTRVKPGLTVVTGSEEIVAARSQAMNALMTYAPQSETLFRIAEEFGLHTHTLPDGCIRCHLCYRICEEIIGAGALKLVHREGHAYIVPVPGRCIGCGTCANVCPTRAIRIEDHDNVRTISIRDEIVGQHPLERCEGCGGMYATPRFLASVEKRTHANHPDTKAHHHYCPACAKRFSDRIRRLSGQ